MSKKLGISPLKSSLGATETMAQDIRVIKLLLALHAACGSWAATTRVIGSGSAGEWCAMAKGSRKMSRAKENAVRFIFGYAPRMRWLRYRHPLYGDQPWLRRPQINYMSEKCLAHYFAHRTPATYPPCVELWLP